MYINKKYDTFERESTKYLEKYPNDVIMRFMRAKTYRKLNRFDEAISDLKYNLNLEINDHSLTELFFIYYYLNKYEEALKIIDIIYNRKCINYCSLVISEIIMRKQLGLEINARLKSSCDYINRQVLEYNENEAIEHIQNHLVETDETHSYFNDGIDLNYLFNLVKNNIKIENKVNTEEILEIYYIGISNIGCINNTPCNFIKVVVIPNTTNILNIYPTNEVDCDHVYNIECDYNKLFNKKVKKLTYK